MEPSRAAEASIVSRLRISCSMERTPSACRYRLATKSMTASSKSSRMLPWYLPGPRAGGMGGLRMNALRLSRKRAVMTVTSSGVSEMKGTIVCMRPTSASAPADAPPKGDRMFDSVDRIVSLTSSLRRSSSTPMRFTASRRAASSASSSNRSSRLSRRSTSRVWMSFCAQLHVSTKMCFEQSISGRSLAPPVLSRIPSSKTR
mmetsp:Transcript_7850/g.31033  ORF Transcript_7850/g.31033 Transcript_7850/m.31033 type:complete len:202 (-) Transcript_7850:1053-1658(-)